MNGYPFAGPGGQKTLHREAAETKPTLADLLPNFVAVLNAFAPCMTPQQVYAEAIMFDNR